MGALRKGARSKEALYLAVGARPNFIKIAPLVKVLRERGTFPYRIIHTGQHYDFEMSKVFFQSLDIPKPDVNLNIGQGSHGSQTAQILIGFEQLLIEDRPKAVVVFGDVNSTLACSLAAAKCEIPVIHIEAGLRSFDRTMPEEINRVVTDLLSDLLLVSEVSGVANLAREGVSFKKVKLVGNIMIDSLIEMLPRALREYPPEKYGLQPGNYAVLTMHRPTNVDQVETLETLLKVFAEIAGELPIIFPIHPRTRMKMEMIGFENFEQKNLLFTKPVGYLESVSLQKNAKIVFTDSGGMQEETSYLRIPCITLRKNTERPITVEQGTSVLVGNDAEEIRRSFDEIMSGKFKRGQEIPLWDGKTAERITDEIFALFR